MIAVFAKAVLLGLSVAAPVGPIGILCIRRTLTDGRRVGLACGLGAATADASYGLVAGLGVTALTTALQTHQALLRIAGAAYLAVLAIQTIRAKPPEDEIDVRAASTLEAWLSTFGLTITNPMTIASFAAMFSAMGFAPGTSLWLNALVVVFGVFLGSALWWWTLSGSVSLFRDRVKGAHLRWINRLSGGALLGFCVYVVASMLRNH